MKVNANILSENVSNIISSFDFDVNFFFRKMTI